jgi:hypothetical protein
MGEEGLKLGRQANRVYRFYCNQLGLKAGASAFKRFFGAKYNAGYSLLRGWMKLADWFDWLDERCQRFVKIYFRHWNFSCLKVLIGLDSPEIFYRFFWGAGQLKKTIKKELSHLLNSSHGIRPETLSENQSLTIADWTYLFAVAGVANDRFEEVRLAATQLALAHGREEVWLLDAVSALKELGFETSVLEKTSQASKPSEKKLFTQAEFDKRLSQEIASHQAQLVAKDISLQQETTKRVMAEERVRVLEQENLALRSQLREQDSPETTVDVTPIVESKSPVASRQSPQTDVFDDYLSLWEQKPFEIGSCIRVVDRSNKDYYGCSGKITGRDRNGWWIELAHQGDKLFKQFSSQQLELALSFEKTSSPKAAFERASQPFQQLERSLFQPNMSPGRGVA